MINITSSIMKSIAEDLPDIEMSRREYLPNNPSPDFYFGVEVSCVSTWEIAEIAKGNGGENPVYGIREGGPSNSPLAIGIND